MSAPSIAVIGRGLIGAAAARHLAKAGARVTLIGPGEPRDKRAHRGVFASHYDEGRITRALSPSPFWAGVAAASIARYGEIAAEGETAFFSPVGAMVAAPAGSAYLAAVDRVSRGAGIAAEAVTEAALATRFPDFAFAPGTEARYEPRAAGHISPRRLVAAQTRGAARAGAAVVAAEVSGLDEAAGHVTLSLPDGPRRFDQALVSAGAMSETLLGPRLGLTVLARTVALFRVRAAEAARLARLPSLVLRWSGPGEPYLLPPIRYPDGAWYAKLGGDPADRRLACRDEIGAWFRTGGDPAVRDHLEAAMRRLMPRLAIEAVGMDACVTTYSASGLPILERLSPRLTVATAGNGAGAKCSDELGRLAAALALTGSDPAILRAAEAAAAQTV